MKNLGGKYEFEQFEDFLTEVDDKLPKDRYGKPKCVWTFNKKTKQMEGYINEPCAIDTETTSYIDKENDIKTGWVYQWMFGLAGVDIKGSDIDELFFILQETKNVLKLNAKRRVAIYIQNMQFDISFLIHRLEEYAPIEDYFIVENRKFLYIRWMGYEFRCQLLLTGESLDTQGKNLTDPRWKGKILKQTGKLNYSKIRLPQYSYGSDLTDVENLYCWMDIDVQQCKIQEYLDNGENIAKIPKTAIGFVRRTLRDKVLSNKQLARMIQNIHMTLDEFDAWEGFASGGFTHGNALWSEQTLEMDDENEGIASFDITSSYPTSCMAFNNYPMSSGIKIYPKTLDEIKEIGKTHLVLFHVLLNNLKLKPNVYEAILSHKQGEILEGAVKDNGKIRRAKRVSFWSTSDHFKDIELFYTFDRKTVGIGSAWKYVTDYLPKEYFETILDLYNKKTQYKGLEGVDENGVAYSIIYQNSKRDVNGVFGDTYMNPIRDVYGFSNGDWDDVKKLSDKERKDALDKYNNNDKRYNSIMWGAIIAANSKSNLVKAIYMLGIDFIYSDTDSVKFFHYSKHKSFFEKYDEWITDKLQRGLIRHGLDISLLNPENKKTHEHFPLGVWDYEYGKPLEKFKFLHAKCYIFTVNGELHCTVAGIKKKDIKAYLERYKDPYKKFKVGLKVPSKYSNKLCRHYAKNGYRLEVTDYKGRVGKIETEKDAVCLEPIPFEIKWQDEYEMLLDWLQKRM